ncbi:hypothetical protein N7495_004766 [Penicillium taxi]|uniref:uncharacterized protein n=1 Tax=Penicillium taxi TaxID=168475 RepID=UPI0025457D33|nr:uncharacterized protein N7495_004766 [Penicillium taxi]KAJ5900022.1 hypothetical protein N7495_004766 [Penicillium taxi]
MPYKIWADLAKIVATASIVIVVTALLVRWRQPLEVPKPKRLTFRVDNIPINDTKELEHNIKSFAEQDPDLQRAVATIICHRLTPRDKHFFCATVSITTSLSGENLCARLSRTSKCYPYTFTCRFDGITPLYEGESGADVDIIAVPGLGSHALGSWKSIDSDEVWLRDFLPIDLPEDLPKVRVLLYGYDTTLLNSLSKQSIEDLGGALLEQINAFRANDGTSRRPIVLIGHSLGGLLIKELLIRARRGRSNADSDLSKACFGLLFFGVPNLGLRNEQLRTIVQGQPNKALIDDLLVDNDSEPSTFLKRLSDQFSESCKGHYRVVTFFERILSPTLEHAQDGKWNKTGRPSLLVTEKSAISTGLYEDKISLNTDHSGLVKYSSRNQADYLIVKERLQRLVRDAKVKVAERFAKDSLYLPQSKIIQSCLKSLAFEDIDSRQNKIDIAATGTYSWLLSHETLTQWTRQNRGLLWIRGKPGSGKSTLMKYALQEIPAVYDVDALVISFFFHGRGHELQKTPLGLYRSLIHQLLKSVSGALTDLVEYFQEQQRTIGEPGDKWNWELQQLQAFLKSSLIRILKTRSVVLCIDALDECGEELAVELIKDFDDLCLSLPSTESRFGICFSCREYPILDLREGSTIVLHKENKADIAAFVRERFSISDIDTEMQEEICTRAEGVFLWAYFVIQRLLRMERNGEPKGKIKAEIKRIPQGLGELYHELIQGMKDRPEALKLMQWICFSTRPLTTVELQWSMVVDPGCAHQTLDECYQSDDFIAEKDIDRRFKTLSCGLTEIVPSRNARIVQFIHQSVKDFFIEHGLLILGQTREIDIVGPTAHYRLSCCCVRYLRMVMISRYNFTGWDDGSNFPFLHYATTSWVSHIQYGEKTERALNDLLEYLDWPRGSFIQQWVEIYRTLELYRAPPSGSTLLHIIARYGLTKLLKCVLLCTDNVELDVDAKDTEYGQTPLSWAAKGGHDAVVKILLDTNKVDVDAKDTRYGQTPLSWAAEGGHDAVVKMLLDTNKVDVDAKSIGNSTPLLLAAWRGHDAVVKMLLDTNKVDVDSKDTEYGRTPLSWATEGGHDAVVKILLDTNKVDVDAKDTKYGGTPLSWAAKGGHDAVVKMLLDTNKVDVDAKDTEYGWTPLSWAAEGGHDAVVKLLLDINKVDVDTKSTDNSIPLLLAAKGGHDAVVKMLLDTNKVDVDAKSTDNSTPLLLAAWGGQNAVVKMLLDIDMVDIDAKDTKYGGTPLSWAAEGGHDAVVKMLLDTNKVDVDSKDTEYGRTPLSWAAEGGHDAVVKMLLDIDKVDVDAKDTEYGRTPLSWAAEGGHDAVVKMLLDTNKVDVDAKDTKYGRTPLSWASENGHDAVVKILLDTDKVDVDAKDTKYGRTPSSWAAEGGHDAVVKMLLNAGGTCG